MLGYHTHIRPTVKADEDLDKIGHCREHILLKLDVEEACNISHGNYHERAESSIDEDSEMPKGSCHQSKIRDFMEHFSLHTSQSWESQQMKKSSLGGFFPSDKSSSAPDEEVIKLLQLLAGDVETNPGPKVSQCVLVVVIPFICMKTPKPESMIR